MMNYFDGIKDGSDIAIDSVIDIIANEVDKIQNLDRSVTMRYAVNIFHDILKTVREELTNVPETS